MTTNVISRCQQALGIIPEHAESSVAVIAHKPAHSARLVVMVDRQGSRLAAAIHAALRLLANGAQLVLRSHHGVVFIGSDAKALEPAGIRAASVRLRAVLLSPASLFDAAARAAESLKAIDLTGALREVSDRLHRLAGAAPLHAFRYSRPAWSKPVMAYQVRHWLALDPISVRTTTWCYRSLLAAAAVAKAWRYFVGHHIIPLTYMKEIV